MMKIGGETSPLRSKTVQPTETRSVSSSQGKGFSDFLSDQQETRSDEELRARLEEIRRQGEWLTRSMTLRELRQYRLMIKQFLEYTAKRGVALKETKTSDRLRRARLYKMIEEVDLRLLEMADDMLNQEEGRMRILKQIGEIHGLLVNAYY